MNHYGKEFSKVQGCGIKYNLLNKGKELDTGRLMRTYIESSKTKAKLGMSSIYTKEFSQMM